MPSNKPVPTREYTVIDSGRTRHGSAREILGQIKANANADSTLKKLSLDEYARVLIGDAPYFLPKAALEFLGKQSYPSEFDKALEYLAAMPSSGVHILTVKGPGKDYGSMAS
jgi:hypothetical protein